MINLHLPKNSNRRGRGERGGFSGWVSPRPPRSLRLKGWLWLGLAWGLFGCQPALLTGQIAPTAVALPTLAAAAQLPTPTNPADLPPPTWTPLPDNFAGSHLAQQQANTAVTFTPTPTREPSKTPAPLPSITPTPTATITPTASATPTNTPTVPAKPFTEYGLNEPLPLDAYPRPPSDNGWGMHWMPTVRQSPADIDKFVAEMRLMHIKWVVFLNDNTNIGDNDYLVERLVANGIMPIMRLYRPDVLPYDGNLGAMVAHYRRKGVIYYQLYNEPNVNIENLQGAANPNVYAVTWAAAARDVINNGGLPGIAALSPGGEYNHLFFWQRTLRALKRNNDAHLLNRTWISLHNYHGTRAFDDLGGFLMFREYDRITQEEIGRSLPIIGTEGGSYHPDPQIMTDLIRFQYTYMADAEPYYFAVTFWLLANQAGGGSDPQWEWQTLFRPGDYKHPVVTEFFYRYRPPARR
jgi:hypothetical protein